MPTRIQDLVKTYKLLNDPQAPSWSIKFVGAIAGVALVVAGVGAIWWASQAEAPGSGNAFAASTSQAAADGTRTDYVGYDVHAFDPARGVDKAALDKRVAEWEAAHPGATILSKEPVWAGNLVVGYNVRWQP